jgi:hypothetical protein
MALFICFLAGLKALRIWLYHLGPLFELGLPVFMGGAGGKKNVVAV